jgi:HAD superfamily hydrolase (TIGR01484 family)
MKPLAQFNPSPGQIKGVLTDIDDTLTTRGRLTVEALQALQQLRDAGLKVVPVTGSPASLALHAARLWPVDAAIGESGAMYYSINSSTHRLYAQHWEDNSQIKEALAHREHMAERILREVPGAALASDQPFRLRDLAVDYCEDVPRLPDAHIAHIKQLLADEGYTVRQSSIHINAWRGSYDKLPMAKRCLQELWGIDVAAERDRWVYVGDAPNDEAMFEFFPNSVGVANIARHLGVLEHKPAFVASAECGAGFAQVARVLCR